MTDTNSYHTPVMLQECLEGLQINPEGIYADLTFGGGGHSKEIAKKLTTGKLYVFDQDADAFANYEKWMAQEPIQDKVIFVPTNFRHLKKFLRMYGHAKIDGILADLGVSSYQFDTAHRGFSFRFDANLDMRMDAKNHDLTAKKIINEYSEKELVHIFSFYGEIINSKTLANLICTSRANKVINTTTELKNLASKIAKRGQENKYLAQLFQALRIVVNEEMVALEEMLLQTGDVLKTGGRLVIMTYHSLEDRPVKNYIKQGLLHGDAPKDMFGNVEKPFESITRKPIEATEEELASNPRARSAKLRIAEKN